jgi:hypothetical protein
MTAEFYLQTIEHVFQKHSLPKGEFVHRGKPIDPDAIRDTALLAIEGERDDISGIGQTRAALDSRRAPAGGEEEVLPRRGSRPLRHLQRQQVAQAHRPGGRGLDPGERALVAPRRSERRRSTCPNRNGTSLARRLPNPVRRQLDGGSVPAA